MEAERRQVTVLFTDMVGFTTFSEKAGEEAAFTLMRSLSLLMDEAVHEQGGVVQSFTGDGIMAVFGASTALEDAPLGVSSGFVHPSTAKCCGTGLRGQARHAAAIANWRQQRGGGGRSGAGRRRGHHGPR